MRLSFLAVAAVAVLPATVSTDAFSPQAFLPRKTLGKCQASTATVTEVQTNPISGMKPGTSGLRKKVEVWQGVDESNKYYVENFIQSLLDTAQEKNGGYTLDT
jgi:phosphoglucomutase